MCSQIFCDLLPKSCRLGGPGDLSCPRFFVCSFVCFKHSPIAKKWVYFNPVPRCTRSRNLNFHSGQPTAKAVPDPAHCSSFEAHPSDPLSFTLEPAHTDCPPSGWLQNPGQGQEKWVHFQRIGYTKPMTSAKCIISFATPRLWQQSPPHPTPPCF